MSDEWLKPYISRIQSEMNEIEFDISKIIDVFSFDMNNTDSKSVEKAKLIVSSRLESEVLRGNIQKELSFLRMNIKNLSADLNKTVKESILNSINDNFSNIRKNIASMKKLPGFNIIALCVTVSVGYLVSNRDKK